jgi:hypothetical protein
VSILVQCEQWAEAAEHCRHLLQWRRSSSEVAAEQAAGMAKDMAALALCMEKQGEEASTRLPVLRDLVQLQTQVAGCAHPSTLRAKEEYARCCLAMCHHATTRRPFRCCKISWLGTAQWARTGRGGQA